MHGDVLIVGIDDRKVDRFDLVVFILTSQQQELAEKIGKHQRDKMGVARAVGLPSEVFSINKGKVIASGNEVATLNTFDSIPEFHLPIDRYYVLKDAKIIDVKQQPRAIHADSMDIGPIDIKNIKKIRKIYATDKMPWTALIEITSGTLTIVAILYGTTFLRRKSGNFILAKCIEWLSYGFVLLSVVGFYLLHKPIVGIPLFFHYIYLEGASRILGENFLAVLVVGIGSIGAGIEFTRQYLERKRGGGA